MPLDEQLNKSEMCINMNQSQSLPHDMKKYIKKPPSTSQSKKDNTATHAGAAQWNHGINSSSSSTSLSRNVLLRLHAVSKAVQYWSSIAKAGRKM